MEGGGGHRKRGFNFPQLANTDVIGVVDSDYGHALDAIIGPAYGGDDDTYLLADPNSYHRYFFVIRDPMYVIAIDELEPGHTVRFHCYESPTATKISEALFTNSKARYELLYPQSGFSSTENGDPIVFTTDSPQLMFLCHPNPSGMDFSKSYSGGLVTVDIGRDKVVYNPRGGTYTQGNISGDARLFAERTGGALIFKATNATGSQYSVSCDVEVNVSISGNQASIYVYGIGAHTVTITSPYGTHVFSIDAGQTTSRLL